MGSDYVWVSNMTRTEALQLQHQGSDGLIGEVQGSPEAHRTKQFCDYVGWYRPRKKVEKR